MNNEKKPVELDKIVCEVCRKEVPLTEAQSPEAEDYVAHFCGLDCYEQWKKESEADTGQGG